MNNIKLNKFKLIITWYLYIFVSNITAQNPQIDYSQNIKSYTLASPEVSSFEKYSLNNANNYVGKLNVSIPIYTIKTGDIEYPLNLVYNTGGIKVDQLASEVGLGWNLTSALISRTINQANDFDNTGRLNSQPDYNTYPDGDKGEDFLIVNKKTGYFLKQLIPSQRIQAFSDVDFLPDTYHFYGNGETTTDFFFNDINSPIEINPKGSKIEATASKLRIDTQKGKYNPYTNAWEPFYNFLTQDFFSIVITTNKGIKYTFSDCDYSINQFTYGITELDSPAQISAWHITKIEDIKNGKKIDFVYENTSSNPNHIAGSNLAFNEQYAQRSYGYSVNTQLNTSDPSTYFYSSNLLQPTARVDIQKKRLKKIIFEDGEINFNYNNIGITGQTAIVRNDVYNSDCLTQVYLKNKSLSIIKTFNFTYDYFSSNYNNTIQFNPDNTLNTYRYNRLKLLKFGEAGKPSYKFSYEEIIKLPPVNSFSIDFLGYYNNSQDLIFSNYSDNYAPTFYYYANQFEKSLLPYPISSMNPVVMPGYFNRQANDYSKAWSLIKMEYPTGGSSEYVYESNQFEEFGQSIKGGGIRIAQQKLNDGRGGTRIINYSYLKDNGQTSGKLSSTPYFGFPTKGNFNYDITYPVDEQSQPVITSYGANYNIEWQLYDKCNLNADITTGSYVGYSKVIESETGKGRKEYNFTSNDIQGYQNIIYRVSPQYTTNYLQIYFEELVYTGRVDHDGGPELRMGRSGNWAIGNSALFSNIFTDNSYKRGKLLEEKIYNETNQLVKTTTINYTDNLINNYSFYQGYTDIIENPTYVNPYASHYYEQYLRLNLEAFITVKKNIKISQFLPSTKLVTDYTASGFQNATTTAFTYNQNGDIKTMEATASNGDIIKNQYYYSQDSQMNTEPYISDLILNNLTGINLKTETYRNSNGNSEKLSELKIAYAKDATTGNFLKPKYTYAKKGTDANSTLEKKVTFNSYDDKGNLTQYTTENGIQVSIIWGYNQTKRIAKIENTAYSSITASLITTAQTKSNTGTEAELLIALTAIRNSLPNVMMTSYTYKPLIGISTVTDPKGDKITYNYDSLNRLLNVKDKNGNILSENEYQFASQN